MPPKILLIVRVTGISLLELMGPALVQSPRGQMHIDELQMIFGFYLRTPAKQRAQNPN